MAAAISMPLVRFAVDPILRKKEEGDKIAVAQLSQLSTEPKRFDYTEKVKDGWVDADEAKTAWLYLDDKGEVVALSPICKHLGCQVNWNGAADFKNEFYCPCHGGRYKKDGVNIPGTPPVAPLDHYALEIKEDGTIYLGKPVKKGAKA
ncbi:MAG: ubiquinol-cytochrome c reductase iron-sulfur subunit [Bacilli bacterium]